MLPSMPLLFNRESQDAFGNKIEPSTSFFSQNSSSKPVIKPEPPSQKILQGLPKDTKETKNKKEPNIRKKDIPPTIDSNALEAALVRSYYTKVQTRFSSNTLATTNKCEQFHNILRSYNPNKETPVDLYRKIERLFDDGHKDIAEEFLLFLKPGQAAQIGRFMDRFMLVQMTGFIEMLQRTFERRPTFLRKILRAISTGLATGNSVEMKNRVLPYLRTNIRLTQLFKLLFPDERPPDSTYESGADVLNESFLISDKGYDLWEFEEENDNKKKLEAKDGLDSMYLHGRVFLQHGRLLRSARVTYPYSKEPYRVHARRLAPAHCHLSPPDSEEERASPKRNTRNQSKIPPKRAKKQLKSPTKNVKDVNDNTKDSRHKDNVPPNILTSKANKSKSQPTTKSKTVKKEEKTEPQKRDRKDSKNLLLKKDAIKNKLSKIETNNKKLEIKSNWTRDEDKTMLQVLKGEAGSEQIFCRIRELLPHRSSTEIKERFCHVMTLLQQMAVGEVT
ncbi:hypothetical protein K1T71_010131 [Dendrolimus kikuchii]|uniref:Uncharacterized protein n=1 Tax=Dendrolimus kikuchii TaxID=765133 RepID=A0ACC1CQV0_9NEOP|nr:hypothetical protein K1T71_010131 [Dendrolimus kikuchii]